MAKKSSNINFEVLYLKKNSINQAILYFRAILYYLSRISHQVNQMTR